MNYPTLRQFLNRATEEKYKQLAKDTWFDWFAPESTLANKTKRLAPIVKHIAENYIPRSRWDQYVVFFKENIPMWTSGTNLTGWVENKHNENDVFWFSTSKTTQYSGTSANYGAKSDTLGVFGRKIFSARAEMSGLPVVQHNIGLPQFLGR